MDGSQAFHHSLPARATGPLWDAFAQTAHRSVVPDLLGRALAGGWNRGAALWRRPKGTCREALGAGLLLTELPLRPRVERGGGSRPGEVTLDNDNGSGRRTFWTTLPGLLTGLAALITAVVGAIALFVGTGSGDSDAHPEATNGASYGGPAGATSSEPTGGGSRVVRATVLLRPSESLDVTTGQVGGQMDVNWAGDQLNLYGNKNVVEDGPTGKAGCERAVASHGSGIAFLSGDSLARPQHICLLTTSGTLADLEVSPPDAHNRVDIRLTSWP